MSLDKFAKNIENQKVIIPTFLLAILAQACIEPPTGYYYPIPECKKSDSGLDLDECGDMNDMGADDMDMPVDMSDMGIDMPEDMNDMKIDADMGVLVDMNDMGVDIPEDMNDMKIDADMDIPCTPDPSTKDTIIYLNNRFKEIRDEFGFLENAPGSAVRSRTPYPEITQDCNGEKKSFRATSIDENGNFVSTSSPNSTSTFASSIIECNAINSPTCIDIAMGNQLAECNGTESRFFVEDGADMSRMVEIKRTISPDGKDINLEFKEYGDCNYSSPDTCGVIFSNPTSITSINIHMPDMTAISQLCENNECEVCSEDLDAMSIRDDVIIGNTIPNY